MAEQIQVWSSKKMIESKSPRLENSPSYESYQLAGMYISGGEKE